MSAGGSIYAAVKKLGDPKLLVKLSTALNSSQDAHAIDIRYHKNCWAKYVTGVLRKPPITEEQGEHTSLIAAKIEFLAMTEIALNNGNVLNMAPLQDDFGTICGENNVSSSSWSRRSVK